MARKRYSVTPNEFVIAWETSETLEEVAKKVSEVAKEDVPLSVIKSRAANYRRMGVQIKKIPSKKASSVDIKKLNDLVVNIGLA